MYSESKFFKRNDKSQLKKPSVLKEGFKKLTKPTIKMQDFSEVSRPTFLPHLILFRHRCYHNRPHHKK